jgi:radical SAM superfamily enzyme YgiQ (UPF0313 family)
LRLRNKVSCDVLYMHPSKSLFKPDYGVVPVGVFPFLQSIRNAGYKVHAINVAVEVSLYSNFNVEMYLGQCSYKVLLIDLHWYEHCFGAIEIARISKKVNPTAIVLLGGITASIFSSEILEQYEFVDYIVRGDADYSTLQLVNHHLQHEPRDAVQIPNLAFKNEDNTVVYTFTKITSNLSECDYVNALDLFSNWQTYLKFNVTGVDWFRPIRSFWLGMARGCPFQCSYCGGSKDAHLAIFNSPKLRMRDVDVLRNEVETLKAKFGVQQIKPTHDLALFNPNYRDQVLDIFKACNMGIYNEFWQIPNHAAVERILTSVNLRVSRLALTAISGNQKVRNKHGKKASNDQVMELVSYMSNWNIGLDVYFSPGLPEETEEIFFTETVPFVELLRKRNPLINVYMQPITLEPLSRLSREMTDARLKTFSDYYNYCKNDNRLEVLGYDAGLSPKWLEAIYGIHHGNNFKDQSQNLHYDYGRL